MPTNWKAVLKKITETLFLIFVMGFMPFIGVVGGFSGCNSPKQKSNELPQKTLRSKEVILQQGHTVKLKDLAYKFNGFRYSKFLIDYWEEGKSAKTENTFLVANITIQNTGKEPEYYGVHSLYPLFVKDSDGNTYHSIDVTEFSNFSNSKRLKFEQLNPKINRSLDLAFEVPRQKNYSLELQPNKADLVNGLDKTPRRNTRNYGY